MKNWNYLELKFKTPQFAYKFARWITFGKEIGFVPEGIEVQFNDKTILIGYYGPK